MKERERIRAEKIDEQLQAYAAKRCPLPGVVDAQQREVLVRQIVDSLRRVEYPRAILARKMSARRSDPMNEEYFDPIRGAAYEASRGNHDEACWLVFLFVAYGKGKHTGWRLIRDVYGRLGEGQRWDWHAASEDPDGMVRWIMQNARLLWPPGSRRPFGAHRQHESIEPSARTVGSYLRWVGPTGHRAKFDAVASTTGGDPRRSFDLLYHEIIADVYRFGRLATFDYLAMLGKLDLAEILPGSAYMTGATGPVSGARLLFAGSTNAGHSPNWLDAQLADLDRDLCVGMQVLEDALCNWQKSPRKFKHFRG